MYEKQDTCHCLECGLPFSRLSNLRRHIRKCHPTKLNELAPMHKQNPANFCFTCQICGKNFNYKKHFDAHSRTHYNSTELINYITIYDSKKCPMCSFKNSFEKNMLSHFEEVHDISIKLEDMQFVSWEKFHQWKTSMEGNTNTKFIKLHIGNYKTHSSITYICNRSGYHMPTGRGLRCLKIQGSLKINAYCPASIKACKYKDGKCQVKFCNTHVGHEVKPCDLSPTLSERHNTATEDIEEETNATAENILIIEVSSVESTDIFEKEEELKKHPLKKLDNIQSPIELEIFEQILQPLSPTLAALDCSSS